MIHRLVLHLALLAATAAMAAAAEPAAKRPAPKPKPKITISKQTTYITEPVGRSGYIDYVAALNQRASRGVTPENNAAVLFWKAMGPKEIAPKLRARYFAMLGIKPLPENGDYYVNLYSYAKRKPAGSGPTDGPWSNKDIDQAENEARKRPWSTDEYPLLAEWLSTNQKPLDLLLEASKRPRRYEPLMATAEKRDDEMLLAIPLLGVQQTREAVRGLVMRATFRMDQGHDDEAWQNLLACHRLARLAGQGPTLVDGLVAMTAENMTCTADQAMLRHRRLSAARIARMRADLAKLPPLTKIADKFNAGERFMFLDCVSIIARKGIGSLSEISALAGDGSRSNDPVKSTLDALGNAAIDWDAVLRMGNRWYDRLADAAGKANRAERAAALRCVEFDMRKAREEATHPARLGLLLLAPRETATNSTGKIFVSLLMPAMLMVTSAEDRWTTNDELNRMAFALAAYHADKGRYPQKLDELAPKYVAKAPTDLFLEQLSPRPKDVSLHYRLEGDGYLLYSVGPNGRDDDGRGYEDCKDRRWDDLVVRMTPPPDDEEPPASKDQ